MTAPSTPPGVTVTITVTLIDKARADLEQTHERSGLSRTDIINRAVSLYEFIDAQIAAGSEIRVRDRDGQTGTIELR